MQFHGGPYRRDRHGLDRIAITSEHVLVLRPTLYLENQPGRPALRKTFRLLIELEGNGFSRPEDGQCTIRV